MSINIRSLQKDDVLICAEIISSIPMFQKYGASVEKSARALNERLQQASRYLYIAEIDQKITGIVDLLECGSFALTPYVQQLVVHPAYSRKGIGQKLMIHVEENHKGKYGISLLVNEQNLTAIQFYERLGYKKVGKIENYIRQNLNELIYFKH